MKHLRTSLSLSPSGPLPVLFLWRWGTPVIVSERAGRSTVVAHRVELWQAGWQHQGQPTVPPTKTDWDVRHHGWLVGWYHRLASLASVRPCIEYTRPPCSILIRLPGVQWSSNILTRGVQRIHVVCRRCQDEFERGRSQNAPNDTSFLDSIDPHTQSNTTSARAVENNTTAERMHALHSGGETLDVGGWVRVEMSQIRPSPLKR